MSEAELSAALSGAVRRGFELAVVSRRFGCSFTRWGMVRTCVLVLLHHIAGDGWSLFAVVAGRGGVFTRRGGAGRPAALPALGVQYADYTLWQRYGAGR